MGCVNPSGSKDAQIAIIQAYPDRLDVREGTHCSSAAGRYLKNVMYSAGLKPSECWWDYLTPEYPGTKGLGTVEAQDNVTAHHKELVANLKKLPNLKLVVVLGKEGMEEFGVTSKLDSIRGYIFENLRDIPAPVLPTYRPYYIFRTGMKNEVTFLNDFEKVARVIKNGYEKPEENFILEPTLRDVHDWLKEVKASGEHLFGDIEAIGHLHNRDYNEITLLGLGRRSDMSVLSIPFRVKGGGHYWKPEQEEKIRGWVEQILTKNTSTWHNGVYDCKHLNYQGFGPVNILDDTLIMHHNLHPELPHSLDYVTSIFTDLPYWKDTLKKAKNQLDLDNIEFRRYNAYDVLAMMLIQPKLEEELKADGLYKVYTEISRQMIRVALTLNTNGMPVSLTKLNTWKASLSKKQDKLIKTIFDSWEIYKDFNFNSGDQLSWLLYGKRPAKWGEKLEEYRAYEEPGTRKSKKTKKYKTLQTYIYSYSKTKPFIRLSKLNVKETKSGVSTDDEMRVRIKEAIITRLGALRNLQRKQEKHYTEEKDLEGMLIVIDCLNEYQEVTKLLSTYTKFHIEPDGRVHGSYKPQGTTTGRLASEAPNMQNIPPEGKKIFVAPKGWKFVQFDYTNLELVVLAYWANIPYLINIFENGQNVHDINTEKFFKIAKSDPKWDTCRRIMKTIEFGRNYGGTIRGIYRRFLAQNSGVRITFDEFKDLDAAYFGNMPEYFVYEEKTLDVLKRTRMLTNAFGRRRIFLGDDRSIEREGLNMPIQSTAADIASIGSIKFEKVYQKAKAKGYKFYPCATVHDSVVALAPDEEVHTVLKLFKKTLCSPLKIGEYTVGFNGEVTVSQSYKADKKVDKIIEQDLNYVLKHYNEIS